MEVPIWFSDSSAFLILWESKRWDCSPLRWLVDSIWLINHVTFNILQWMERWRLSFWIKTVLETLILIFWRKIRKKPLIWQSFKMKNVWKTWTTPRFTKKINKIFLLFNNKPTLFAGFHEKIHLFDPKSCQFFFFYLPSVRNLRKFENIQKLFVVFVRHN